MERRFREDDRLSRSTHSRHSSHPYQRPHTYNKRYNAPHATHRSTHTPHSLEDHIKSSDSLLAKDEFLRLARPSDSDLEAAYDSYIREHQRAFLLRFFAAHGGDPWLLALYNVDTQPTVNEQTRDALEGRVNFFSESILPRKFSLTLQSDQFVDARRDLRMLHLPFDTHSLDFLLPEGDKKRQLYFNNVPPNTDPSDLLAAIKQTVPNAQSIVLSNPVPSRGFTRSGWLTLSLSVEDITELADYPEVRRLDGMQFAGNHLSFYPRDSHRKIKLIPGAFISPGRIHKDLMISRDLITSMNVSRGIAFDMAVFDGISDERERLDAQLLFLRSVHWVCYYSAYEAACPEELYRHCGELAMRDPELAEEDIGHFDTRIQLLIDRGYRGLSLRPVGLDTVLTDKYMEQLEEAKYRCRECTKLFKGPEFVLKHLGLKHEDVVAKEKTSLSLLDQILDLPHFFLLPSSLAQRPTGQRRRSIPSGGQARENRRYQRQPQQSRQTRDYVDLDAPKGMDSMEISYDL